MAVAFDGVELDRDNLEPILRDAAHGQSPIHDLNAAQTPTSWVLPLVEHVKSTPLRDALEDAIANIAKAGTADEVALVMEAQRTSRVLTSNRLWDALVAQHKAGHLDACEPILLALISQQGKGELWYDDRLRALVDAGLSDLGLSYALALLGVRDRAWLVGHAGLLVGLDDDTAAMRMGDAATAQSAAELAAFRDELAAAYAQRGKALPATMPFDAMIESRRKAETT